MWLSAEFVVGPGFCPFLGVMFLCFHTAMQKKGKKGGGGGGRQPATASGLLWGQSLVPKLVVESPSLEIFESFLDTGLGTAVGDHA